jgi:putative AdoMet-dependent methyltransferase
LDLKNLQFVKFPSMSSSVSYFDEKSKEWDKKAWICQVSKLASQSIRETLGDELCSSISSAMDFGCGSGTLALQLLSLNDNVRVCGVDSSQGMIDVFVQKVAAVDESERNRCEARCVLLKGSDGAQLGSRRFDLIVSSLTLHHIDDIDALLRTLRAYLGDRGRLVVFDLEETDAPDSTLFHSEHALKHANVTVPGGFSAARMREHLIAAGFDDEHVQCSTAFDVDKPSERGDMLTFRIIVGQAMRVYQSSRSTVKN